MKKRNSSMQVEIMQKVVDKLPNEVDESSDPIPAPPQTVIKQAAADLARGLVDTDRGAAVNLTYKKQTRK